jgi:hypothetical protein
MEGQDGRTACVGGSMESYVEETMWSLNTVFLRGGERVTHIYYHNTKLHTHTNKYTVNILPHIEIDTAIYSETVLPGPGPTVSELQPQHPTKMEKTVQVSIGFGYNSRQNQTYF